MPTLLADLGQHVELTLIALGSAIVISLPLGVAAYRWTGLRLPALEHHRHHLAQVGQWLVHHHPLDALNGQPDLQMLQQHRFERYALD